MDKNFLKNESNALLAQKHQVQIAEAKLAEINNALDLLHGQQSSHKEMLDKLMLDMDTLLEEVGYDENCALSEQEEQEYLVALQAELDSMPSEVENVRLIDELDIMEFDETMSFDDYVASFEAYAQRNGLDLTRDPFDSLMSKTQQIELQKRIREEFSYKNAQCDKYDYLIAGTCGVIGGIIDIVFVGAPGQSKLGNFTDEMANKATEKFARLCGWEGEGTKSAIGFLENKFRVNYDQSTTSGKKNSTNGKVSNLSMKNHHLKSLGHSPDPIGLFFSILNQFTSTSSFLSNGQLITIDTESFELRGGNFIAKVFCGFTNWLGHLMSDWTGSSGAQGRGSGIPIPFYNLFQLCDFGRFGEKGQETFAVITSKVFEQGYDFRHGMAMAIPVVITELLIRLMYVVKARFYHRQDWKDCMPNASIPELRRMLLIGHGALCAIDGIDAAVRSGNPIVNPVEFLLRTNLIGWVHFGYLSLKEVGAWWNEGKIDEEALDKYLDEDLQRMLQC
ncbi:MAG: hypothetical protein HDT11_04965 [Helicobacter sp.]|nr:hypothetical protein [Helicobacter sp.]